MRNAVQRRFKGCMTIMDFLLVLGVAFGLLLVVLTWVGVCKCVDLIILRLLSKKYKKDNDNIKSESEVSK